MSELREEIIRQITDDPIKGAATLCDLQDELTAAQATIEELKAEIAEWESGALVRGWREQWADRQAAKEKES